MNVSTGNNVVSKKLLVACWCLVWNRLDTPSCMTLKRSLVLTRPLNNCRRGESKSKHKQHKKGEPQKKPADHYLQAPPVNKRTLWENTTPVCFTRKINFRALRLCLRESKQNDSKQTVSKHQKFNCLEGSQGKRTKVFRDSPLRATKLGPIHTGRGMRCAMWCKQMGHCTQATSKEKRSNLCAHHVPIGPYQRSHTGKTEHKTHVSTEREKQYCAQGVKTPEREVLLCHTHTHTTHTHSAVLCLACAFSLDENAQAKVPLSPCTRTSLNSQSKGPIAPKQLTWKQQNVQQTQQVKHKTQRPSAIPITWCHHVTT